MSSPHPESWKHTTVCDRFYIVCTIPVPGGCYTVRYACIFVWYGTCQTFTLHYLHNLNSIFVAPTQQ